MTDMNALESIYFAALEKPPAERPAFLDGACGTDADLRARVERLLAAQPRVGGFLDGFHGRLGYLFLKTFMSLTSRCRTRRMTC